MKKELREILDSMELKIRAAAAEGRSHIPVPIEEAIEIVNQSNALRRDLDHERSFVEGVYRNIGARITTTKEIKNANNKH